MAELHVVGQIVGATGFGNKAVFCKWGCQAGRAWELLEGLDAGQTQVDSAECDDLEAVWAHPLDIHYACRALSGWPRLHFQVWTLDSSGRTDICGYGFCHVPTAPGMFELECPTWLPQGSAAERMASFFVGGHPRLKVEEVICNPGDRFRLSTAAAGVVHLQIGVVMKDFDRNNVHFG